MSFDFDTIKPTPELVVRVKELNVRIYPDELSSKLKITETADSSDNDTMVKIVAKTCKAEFHKRKGYIDSNERSALTFRELEKLFDIHLPNKPVKFANIIIELDDCFIYCSDCDSNAEITINPAEFKVPKDERFIIYVLNQDVINKLQQEKAYIQRCEEIFERLTAKNQKKPVLVFRWVGKISRGNHDFSAVKILGELAEFGFERILQFEGVYGYRNTDNSGLINLGKELGLFIIRI